MTLAQEIESALPDLSFLPAERLERFKTRLTRGGLSKQDDDKSHFSAMFLPFNRESREVMLGDHKKAGTWLSPGGHTEAGETLLQILNREIEEELGVSNFYKERPPIVYLTIKDLPESYKYTCREHFDVWHIMETDGSDFEIDYAEYNEVLWLSFDDAIEITQDDPHKEVLAYFKENL